MSQKSKRDKDPKSNNQIFEIPLAFTKQNLIQLLSNVLNGSSIYSHQDLANWTGKFNMHCMELFDKGEEVDEKLEDLLLDMDMQWDLYLTNTYSLDELQTMDRSQMKMPKQLFQDWLKRLQ